MKRLIEIEDIPENLREYITHNHSHRNTAGNTQTIIFKYNLNGCLITCNNAFGVTSGTDYYLTIVKFKDEINIYSGFEARTGYLGERSLEDCFNAIRIMITNQQKGVSHD